MEGSTILRIKEKKIEKVTRGFTLIEVIVVIAILGILAGIAVQGFQGSYSKGNKQCVSRSSGLLKGFAGLNLKWNIQI